MANIWYEKVDTDATFLLSVYEELAPYIVTDCSAETLSSMLERYADFTITEAVTPAGENLILNGYYEFHVDEEKLEDLIMYLFYRPKQ